VVLTAATIVLLILFGALGGQESASPDSIEFPEGVDFVGQEIEVLIPHDDGTLRVEAERSLGHRDGPSASLTSVRFEVTAADGEVVRGQAQRGEVARAGQAVEMEGSVQVVTDSAYELQTEKLQIQPDSREMVSPGPLELHGPGLLIRAARGRMVPSTQTFHLEGPMEAWVAPNVSSRMLPGEVE